MPLLCISLLALLLLPPSLSCNSKRPAKEIRGDYIRIVQFNLNITRENITTLLQNTSCPYLKDKPPNCTSENVNLVNTLYALNCRMKNLGLPHTERLTTIVLYSIRCPCPEGPTGKPKGQRMNEQRRIRKENRKLCRAKEMLSNMTECYQILSAQSADT